ncbi:MAG: type III-B CRISPR module RAMP protein Cmr4 [Syntrophaceae bacterium]
MTVEGEKKTVGLVWRDSAMCAIYTLTPTHCGIGQTAASVDLPVARDEATGFPVLPATALKGAAREYFEATKVEERLTAALFGPSLDRQEDSSNSAKPLRAAGLAFTEGRLAAWPARSLNRPFLHVTCPLIIERLVRDARLLGREELAKPQIEWLTERAYVGEKDMAGKALVIEDLCFAGKEVLFAEEISEFAAALAALLPEAESDTAERLKRGLVVVPDAEFSDLLERTIPVVARTQLTGGKTTDTWYNPVEGRDESGNLWYEEYLPSDCLFISFIGQRRQVYMQNDTDGKHDIGVDDPIGKFLGIWKDLPFIQIGGNETVGYGLCLWNVSGRPGRKP